MPVMYDGSTMARNVRMAERVALLKYVLGGLSPEDAAERVASEVESENVTKERMMSQWDNREKWINKALHAPTGHSIWLEYLLSKHVRREEIQQLIDLALEDDDKPKLAFALECIMAKANLDQQMLDAAVKIGAIRESPSGSSDDGLDGVYEVMSKADKRTALRAAKKILAKQIKGLDEEPAEDSS